MFSLAQRKGVIYTDATLPIKQHSYTTTVVISATFKWVTPVTSPEKLKQKVLKVLLIQTCAFQTNYCSALISAVINNITCLFFGNVSVKH